MNLIFSVEGKPAFRLKKLSPGWELEEWREARKSEGIRNKGAQIPARWERMNKNNGCYPSNVLHAMSIITERLLESHGKKDTPVIDGLDEIVRKLNTITVAEEAAAEKAKELL